MNPKEIKYPRRTYLRTFIYYLARFVFGLLADVHIVGEENIPEDEPLLVVGNHFSFIDPVCFISIFSWQIEFVGGAQMPHVPNIVKALPKTWGYYPLYRGTGAKESLRAAEEVIKKGGLLGIFPEGGSWAEVLRPARPGTAYLATRTGARILPIGLHGLNDIFPLELGKRAKVELHIGKPFGPFRVEGRGRKRREELDRLGHEIMKKIAELLPDEKRGRYANSPKVRAVAKKFEAYPWENKLEGEVIGKVH